MLIVLVSSALLAASGQVLLKVGATGRHSVHSFLNGWIVAGLAAYLLSVVLWIYALSRAPLTVVYPFTALTFVLAYVAGLVLFKESTSGLALVGVTLIIAGLYLTTR